MTPSPSYGARTRCTWRRRWRATIYRCPGRWSCIATICIRWRARSDSRAFSRSLTAPSRKVSSGWRTRPSCSLRRRACSTSPSCSWLRSSSRRRSIGASECSKGIRCTCASTTWRIGTGRWSTGAAARTIDSASARRCRPRRLRGRWSARRCAPPACSATGCTASISSRWGGQRQSEHRRRSRRSGPQGRALSSHHARIPAPSR